MIHLISAKSPSVVPVQVVTTEGQTYERAAIEAWLKDHNTDPFSGVHIGKRLTPNVLVRKLLENAGQF